MDKTFGVFLDIDGCLISRDGNVCLNYYEANSKLARLVGRGFAAMGPSIRLCSGRDKNSVELMANFFGMVNSWMIVEGGAAIFNPTTREVKMNPAITPEIQEAFRQLAEKELPVILKRYACLQRYLGYMICYSLEKKPNSDIDIQTIVDYLEGVKTPAIQKKPARRSPGLLTKLIRRKILKIETYFNRMINIIPAGVSKGTAGRFLMEIEGWNHSWCIAVGDSESDFPLFRSVGRIGCPSNATEACIRFVKEKHGKVSMYPYTRGVVDVINWYLGTQVQD
jgi:HAD superfamily hydrolase (TIGR01484 family)